MVICDTEETCLCSERCGSDDHVRFAFVFKMRRKKKTKTNSWHEDHEHEVNAHKRTSDIVWRWPSTSSIRIVCSMQLIHYRILQRYSVVSMPRTIERIDSNRESKPNEWVNAFWPRRPIMRLFTSFQNVTLITFFGFIIRVFRDRMAYSLLPPLKTPEVLNRSHFLSFSHSRHFNSEVQLFLF